MMSLPDFREKSVVIFFSAEGHKISFNNDNLLIRDEEGKTILQQTCHRIFSLWVVGHTTLTTGILQRSKKFGFSVFLMSMTGRLYGVWNNALEGNFLLREKQYAQNDIGLARHLVKNKIDNQARLINSLRKKTLAQKEAVRLLRQYRDQVTEVYDLKALLGVEGAASRLYFGNWFVFTDWQGRRPRAKTDPVNVLLDMGYTYLFYFVESILNLYGFDLYRGIYHRNFYQRKSLVCDLVEPFRCIVDKQVKRAHGLGQFKPTDFNKTKTGYMLSYRKSKPYTKWLMEAILANKEEIFSYIQAYYRAFMRNKPVKEYPVYKVI